MPYWNATAQRTVGFEFYVPAEGESMQPECRLGVISTVQTMILEDPLSGPEPAGQAAEWIGRSWPLRHIRIQTETPPGPVWIERKCFTLPP